jgi:hypothetical protein
MTLKSKNFYIGLIVVLSIFVLSSMTIAATNELSNPGFEKDGTAGEMIPTGWTSFTTSLDGGRKIEVSREVIRSGSYSVKLVSPITSGVGVKSDLIPVADGMSYMAETYAFIPDDPENKAAQMYMEYCDGNGKRIAHRSLTLKEKGKWMSLTITPELLPVPEGAKYVAVILYSPKKTSVLGVKEVYFDDVIITAVK